MQVRIAGRERRRALRMVDTARPLVDWSAATTDSFLFREMDAEISLPTTPLAGEPY